MVQPSLAPEEDTTNSTRSTTQPDQGSIPTVETESRRDRPTQIAIPPLQLSVLQGLEGPTHQFTHSPTSIQPSPTASAPTVSPSTNDLPGASEKQGISQLPAPLRSRPVASQTFAEGMNGSLQALRRKTIDRLHHRRDTRLTMAESSSAAAADMATGAVSSGIARPIMPRSRPSMAQFRMRDQPSKMIIPPPYGQEKVQEAAKALAAGIPNGIPHSNIPVTSALSDSGSATSDDEPEVRVHFEIHLQDAENEPICPLSKKNVGTLAQELCLNAQERADVAAIQTTEELAAYFEKIPRDYDVQLVISDTKPGSPGVKFAPDYHLLEADSLAVVRRESISSSHRKKSTRRKHRYRRPTTDLSIAPIEEPKASWLELFYDLLFVANLTEFTHNHPITGSEALAHYIGWFVIMWWSWAGQTFWAARYDMDDLFTKVLKLIEFCALVSFGAFSSDHLDRTSTGFITSYIVLKAILVIEYGNVLYWARRNRSKKSLTPLWLQISSNLLAMLVWSLSILVHSLAWRYVMWYFTIVVEAAVLVSFGRRTSVTFAGSHLPERFALFTIIVLGENIIGLVGLSAGASAWTRGSDPFLGLFLLTVVILYALWWLYFDDFSEDVFHKTTTLSQLWAYLHLPFHVCIVLVGTGSLDLIRLYKLEHHITEIGAAPSHMISTGSQSLSSLAPTYRHTALGFEVPLHRAVKAGGGGGSLSERDTDYDLTKQYFLVVCSLVFLCNSLLKWINLRSYDKFQRIVYLSRFLNAVFILCLLAVPLDKMTPFSLLGSMAFFCALQVAVDLAVIYFGAYGFVNDLEAWARSARTSIDLGSFLPSPLGGRSRANSRANSRPGSIINMNSPTTANGHGAIHHQRNNSTASLMTNSGGAGGGQYPQPLLANVNPYFPSQLQPYRHHERQFSLQRHSSIRSQQTQQALYNMHVNANSLGVSGAYGNLAQALAEIKKREQMNQSSREGSLPIRPLSLSAAERGEAGRTLGATGSDENGTRSRHHSTWLGSSEQDGARHQQRQQRSSQSSSLEDHGSSSGANRSPPASDRSPGAGALGLANLFNQPLSSLT
ncbi:MAG: bacterial low temperature requirement A protein-domain-containing protein [Benniella sp.]|nr:MAG: bacterial low temperature requirement A protein-domain-containing protein [Benniella sp.]